MEGLGLSVPTLIAQIVAFGVLLVLLRMFAYKPLLRMFDERAKKIKDSIDDTERIREQATRAEEDSKRRIDEAVKEGQELMNRASQAADGVRQQAQARAQEEAQSLIRRAREEIQRERDEALGTLRREFADITMAAAEKVIDRSLDSKAHRDIIDKVLEESKTLRQG